jgi:O-antigen chain-terminating methyltransferase
MKEGFYKAFEDQHRGSRELIRTRQEVYLDFLRPLAAALENPQAIDLGCGRGEFLEILLAAGFRARGVDLDEGMLEDCLRLGLPAEKGEAVSFLSQVPSNSQAVVSAFHVVEHIPFEQLAVLVAETYRVLVPGGIMIFETPNPENPRVGHYGFFMDPTHQKPIPPPLLSFVAEYQGFQRVKILRLQESLRMEDKKPLGLLDVLTGVSPDYSIVAQKNASPEITASLDSAFSREYGIQIQQLTGRYDDSLRQGLEEAAQKGQQRKAQQEAIETSVRGLKEELAQQRKAQQEAVEISMAEMKREIVAEIHSLIDNLVEKAEKNRLEVSARIDSMEDGMEGRIVEVAEYAAKIQEAVVSPSSYLIPAPFSWYSYLYKMLGIQRPAWINKKKQLVLSSKRPRFWQRLRRSIRKRIKMVEGAWNFDPIWYLEAYPEVSKGGADPLSHYINFGKGEGRYKNKSEEGIGKALIRMVNTLRKKSLTTDLRIILEQVESAFWVVTLKQTSKPLDGLVKISARNRYDEFRLGEGLKNKKSIRILLKLSLGIQKLSISFVDKYRGQKTEVTKLTRVSSRKRSQSEELVSQDYDGFVDLSLKPPRATIWRRWEASFRHKRKKLLSKPLLTCQQSAQNGCGNPPMVALTLNDQSNEIFEEIKRIHN